MYIHIFGFKGFISCKNNFLFTHNHILKIQNAYPLFYLLQNNFPIRHLVHGDKTVFHKKTKIAAENHLHSFLLRIHFFYSGKFLPYAPKG